tara:strand:+ start:6657 stop:7886 length:1230 start_codon:yes stop_codon:yes gene_type:complete
MKKLSKQSNLINRKICICKSKLHKKIDFGPLPLINDYGKKKNSKKYPTILTQCKKCLLIQLKYSVKDKLLFPKNYPYLTGDSKEKLKNFSSLVSLLKKVKTTKKPKIIDIGGNDGSLLRFAKNKGFKVLNIEPTDVAKISIKKGVKTLKKEFNYKQAKLIKKKYSNFDYIVSTNFFAHTNNLEEIINSTKLILDNNGLLIIEVQYLYSLFPKRGFDSFHQDHKFYYTATSITNLFRKFKLFVFDAQILKNHGEMLRIYVSLKNKKFSTRFLKILNEEKDKKIIGKINSLNKFRLKFNKKFKELIYKIVKNKKTVYGIGAAPRGCVMLNSPNFSSNEIKMVGEMANSLKCNKYVPGTDIIVKDENKIVQDQPDYVVILAWHLKKRISQSLKRKGFKGKFIIPLPDLRIVR